MNTIDPTHINLSVQYISDNGYPVEAYWVTTNDGYILYLVRIPFGRDGNNDQKRPPVLIMHGLLSSSQDWVAYGRNRSLPLFCVDNGYDVWLGNYRGAPGSVNHTLLDPQKDAEKFWDISFNELGVYDLPALIDFILEKTGEEKLFYIGHSQGGTTFFVMASELPAYNGKIRLASLLASVTEISNPTNGWLIAVAKFWRPLWEIIRFLRIYEIPISNLNRFFGKLLCFRSESVPELCRKFLFLLNAYDVQGQLTPDILPDIFNNFPGSASLTQVFHILQFYDSHRWQKFDYGPNENLRRYGSPRPPAYNISSATSPIAYYHSSYDFFTNSKDAEDFAKTIPNLVLFYTVPYRRFNHIDFVIGKDVIPLLYDKMIDTMMRF
ncbi:hypothetical protein HHI36_010343 [Cryptolaemus montrouzieri]|uniref:Lipase n=1 Tax=Cryptolaemus montrouzieri TaxID=559131 RepID=A0ABD2MII1_9CUCU